MSTPRRLVIVSDAVVWKHRLSHVRWIGGPPDAGKSTVTDLLGEWFDVQVYKQDRHEMEHIERADPHRHPLHVAMRERIAQATKARPFTQFWVDNAPDALVGTARSSWTERIDMVCHDLAAMNPHRPIIAEGPGFFPDVIAPLLPDPRHAIWLIPTEAFKRASHHRRDKSAWRFETSDPSLAMANHIRRDLLFAEAYRRDVVTRDLPWIEIDGSETAETIARRVANHFGLHQG